MPEPTEEERARLWREEQRNRRRFALERARDLRGSELRAEALHEKTKALKRHPWCPEE